MNIYCNPLFGYEVVKANISNSQTISIKLKKVVPSSSSSESEIILQPTYLIAADGAHSFIRQSAGISMDGTENIQQLLNVHFICPGLRQLLRPKPAMLYFVFNEVCNLVCVKFMFVIVAAIVCNTLCVCHDTKPAP
jgi:2-polyprenyl-6-methoxyphenol hydroxylase-like FAD-dependent oxidoreductase